MTKEDLQYLEKYEQNFRTAINANYTRNIVGSALERMKEIYERETGKQYRLCTHCTSSVLAFLKVMGKLYLDQKGNEPKVTANELETTVTQKERSECSVKENKKVKNKKQ